MANNSLMKFTERKIGDNNQLQIFVQEARSVANVIFPETLPFSDKYCKLGVEIVTIDPNNTNHIYKNESGGYCLHLSKLNEIAKAAKIRVVDSKILERRIDERGQVTFISHQVTVEYRTVTGEMIRESYTGKYDYFNDLATKKEGQVKSRRKHAEALAESNALTRAFNKVLPQLPQSFDMKDFSKPFLVPYVLDDKDALIKDLPPETQNKIQEDLARKRLGIADQIYNAPKPPIEDAQIIDETITKQPQPPSNATTGISKEEENKILANEFRQATQEERTEKILNLIKIKGWKHPQGVEVTAKMIEKASLNTQIARIEELLNMSNAEVEAEVSL